MTERSERGEVEDTALRFQAEVARQDATDAWDVVTQLCETLAVFMKITTAMLRRHDSGQLALPEWLVKDMNMACHLGQHVLEKQVQRIMQDKEAKRDGGTN